jgi:hypothetical protein
VRARGEKTAGDLAEALRAGEERRKGKGALMRGDSGSEGEREGRRARVAGSAKG